MTEERDPMNRFDEALRDLAARPPGRSPAAAARDITARIEGRERSPARFRPAWAWSAAALLAAVGIAGMVGVRLAPRANAPAPAPGRDAGAATLVPGGALAEGQVLIWLDSETPLYMNFAPPAGARNDGGGS